MDKLKTDITALFSTAKNNDTFLKVCAPMVRYSKLQYRCLLRRYNTDLCFSPMILADSFCQSYKARNSEFSTSSTDSPLIVQFAAKTDYDFVGASELVYPYADGVDLNCGCPQRWAMKDGYGCSLLNTPETIHSMVRTFKNHLPNTFSVSVKIRLLKDLKQTIELCRGLENCGINFLTVHGRRPWQKSSESVDTEALKEIKKSILIPMVANGNIKTLEDAQVMYENVRCDGIMSAQGMLTNPALFTGENITPMSCLQDWLNINKTQTNVSFQCFHHHLVFMLEKVLTKTQKRVFNYLTTFEQIEEFLFNTFDIKYDESGDMRIVGDEIVCNYNQIEYSTLKRFYDGFDLSDKFCVSDSYSSENTNGKYFQNVIENSCDLDNMDSTLFDETI